MAKKSLPFKIFVIILILCLYLFLPVYLGIHSAHRILTPLLFYLSNALIFAIIYKKYSEKKYRLNYQIDSLQERMNILSDQNSQELNNKTSLQEKIRRYNSLKKVIEEINQSLDLDSVAQSLISIASALISKNKGVAILYLMDKEAELNLKIYKTKKEDDKLIIKAKEGDIFDFWVLRHGTPLLVEDIKKDFRFDLERLKAQDIRPIQSLIAAPLLSEQRFFGILRLDNPEAHYFSQEDLRLLLTICDLGAVALENSMFFQETQELAIHDSLTSLYTKGYFIDRLKEEVIRAGRQQSVLSLLMLDIDYFKNYNDKFGHTAGDIVLRNLSSNIVQSLKELNPIVSRFGGEEFCIALAGVNKKKAREIAEELRKRIENEKIVLRREVSTLTVSIGVATFPQDATDQDNLILKSDKAMYEAKQKGRNRVVCI